MIFFLLSPGMSRGLGGHSVPSSVRRRWTHRGGSSGIRFELHQRNSRDCPGRCGIGLHRLNDSQVPLAPARGRRVPRCLHSRYRRTDRDILRRHRGSCRTRTSIALLVIALTVVVGSADGHILQPLVMGRAENCTRSRSSSSLPSAVTWARRADRRSDCCCAVWWAKFVTGRDPNHPYPSAPCDRGSPHLMLPWWCCIASRRLLPSVDARCLRTNRAVDSKGLIRGESRQNGCGPRAIKARSPNNPAAPFLALPENRSHLLYCKVPTSSADTPVASQMGSRAALTSPSVPLLDPRRVRTPHLSLMLSQD